MSDEKSPLDQAVELAVYAPLGFALEARRLLPTFVERGRQQVTMAKMIGQFAVKQGQSEAEKHLTKVQGQAESLLNEFGLGGVTAEAKTEPSVAPEPTAQGAAAATDPVPVRSSAAAATLPIADYDSLAASQVIPRLGGLSPAELAAVRSYEVAHRGRKTILGKVAQLTGD